MIHDSLAWKMAWREARASAAKFVFVVFGVAAGVGALTGVRGFSAAFQDLLRRESRTILAADLTLRQFTAPSEAQMEADRALARPRGSSHAHHRDRLDDARRARLYSGAGLGQGRRPARLPVLWPGETRTRSPAAGSAHRPYHRDLRRLDGPPQSLRRLRHPARIGGLRCLRSGPPGARPHDRVAQRRPARSGHRRGF